MILMMGSESEYLYFKIEDTFYMLNGTDLKYRRRFWRIVIASSVLYGMLIFLSSSIWKYVYPSSQLMVLRELALVSEKNRVWRKRY